MAVHRHVDGLTADPVAGAHKRDLEAHGLVSDEMIPVVEGD